MIYTIATSKGGTGKTTTAAAIAQAAAYNGKKALAVDLDPQGNLSFCLAADATKPGSYELLHGRPAADLIQKSHQGMDIIPASPNLQTETSAPGSARRLQKALEPLKRKYNLIIIDTPATAGELMYNALQAADRLIIPLLVDAYNLQSLYQLTTIASQIKASGNPRLKIAGVILTQYDGRANVTRQLRDILESKSRERGIPFLGVVRKAVAVQEAAALQESLFTYAPRSNPAQDYMSIFETITK